MQREKKKSSLTSKRNVKENDRIAHTSVSSFTARGHAYTTGLLLDILGWLGAEVLECWGAERLVMVRRRQYGKVVGE